MHTRFITFSVVLTLIMLCHVHFLVGQDQVGQTIYGPDITHRAGRGVTISSDGLSIGFAYDQTQIILGGGDLAEVHELINDEWVIKGGPVPHNLDDIADPPGNIVMNNDANTLLLTGATVGNPGQTEVREWDGSKWVQKGQIIQFSGISSAISDDGDRIMIGIFSGVFVYDFNGTEWVQVGSTIGVNNPIVDMSGDGNTLAIMGQTSETRAEIYRWNGADWAQIGQALPCVTPNFSETVWASLSDNGDRVVVINENGSGHRVIQTYDLLGGSWQPSGSDITFPTMQWPGAVELSGDAELLALTVRQNTTGFPYDPVARLYQWSGASWSQVGVDIENNATEGRMTIRVADDLRRVVVGALSESNPNGDFDAGAVRVFDFCSVKESTDIVNACDQFIWRDGITYTESNQTATYLSPQPDGCDSTYFLDLTINTSTSGTDFQVACDSFTWIDDVTYFSSIVGPQVVLINDVGCDSVVTLDLTINNSSNSMDQVTACDSFKWIDGITYYESTNQPQQIIQDANGCDIVLTLDLTINKSVLSVDTLTACDSLRWIDGMTYNESIDSVFFTLQTIAGCDSTIELNLTIFNTIYTIDSVEACGSFTWNNGITYISDNNMAMDTLSASNGCDSIVRLNLDIQDVLMTVDAVTACDMFTWNNGITYTESTSTPTDTLTSINGCDSIARLDLTLNTSVIEQTSIIACDSFLWNDGVTYYMSTQVADTLLSAIGCDSIIQLDLTIVTANTDVIVDGNTLSTAIEHAAYQWLDCDDNFNEIAGATDRSFSPEVSGSYAVRITDNMGCEGTSECVNLTIVSTDEIHELILNIYPNPIEETMNVAFSDAFSGEYSLFNAHGQLIETISIENSKVLHRSLSIPSGIYFLVIKSNNGASIVQKIMKQ